MMRIRHSLTNDTFFKIVRKQLVAPYRNIAPLPGSMYEGLQSSITAPVHQPIPGRSMPDHDNRRPKFRLLLLNLFMLAVVIISAIIIFYSIQSTGILIMGLAFIPLFALVGLMIGIPMLLQASLCVGAFSNGLLYAKNTQVTVLGWSDIKRFKQQTIKSSTAGTLRLFTIYTHDGKIIQMKAPYLQVDNLGKIIRENVA
jgi:hypothetical protein